MARKRFDNTSCAVARALDEVGDWWSLRVVLQAMQGTRRFVDFQQELGIARNILCDRLRRLVQHGVLCKINVGKRGCRYEYRLTDKGRDLFTALEALRQWGERWTPAPPEQRPLIILDRRTGRPVAPVRVYDADGHPLTVRDVIAVRDSTAAAAGGSATGTEP